MQNTPANDVPASNLGRGANDNQAFPGGRAAPQWQRANLEEWRNSLTPQRQRDDARKLAGLFNAAAQVPELRDALDWARAHGIEFIVDHAVEGSGYYPNGSGVVAIAASCFAPKPGEERLPTTSEAVAAAVHEIRHAWQDYHGMMPTIAKSFAGLVMRVAVVEADATAHEKLAVSQFRRAFAVGAHLRQGHKSARETRRKETRQLWSYFKDWYRTDAAYYSGIAEAMYAAKFGIPGAKSRQLSEFGYEFVPEKAPGTQKTEGLDVSRLERLRSLGKGFRGGNYFDAADRDLLRHEFLSAARAVRLYATDEVSPVAAEIRRCELRRKHAAKMAKA